MPNPLESPVLVAALIKKLRDDGRLAKDVAGDVNITGRNLAAMTLGLGGDLASLVPGSRNSVLGSLPGSDRLVNRFGGDPKHLSYLPTALAAPGPGEIKGLSAFMAGKGAHLAQSLFHGTPHKFDKFELEKIGTGEGAQAYGHGLYFAESPGVAKSYQSKLGETTAVFRNGEPIDVVKFDMNEVYEKAAEGEGALRGARKLWADRVEQGKTYNQPDKAKHFAERVRVADDVLADMKAGNKYDIEAGHLYEVDIPDETIGKMLDWDAPMSEQPENVRKALAELSEDMQTINKPNDPTAQRQFLAKAHWLRPDIQSYEKATGADIYESLVQLADNNPEEASRVLSENYGIPGIRYLDGSSRNVVGATADGPVSRLAERLHRENGGDIEKTLDSLMEKYPAFDREALKKALPDTLNRKRNIVVFNPDDIREVKRDGELVYKTSGL